MRQLTNGNGDITFAQSYDPFGVIRDTSHLTPDTSTAYGYTGEQQSNDMVYLRSRYYNVADGRFQSRDTWVGDANRPMSMNRWNYVDGNPVNLTDPSGYHPDCVKSPTSDNIDYIENNCSNLAKSDWLDTYVAAGIAVQCHATDWDWWDPDELDGEGDAQTTDKELSTPWGQAIKNGEDEPYAYGKLCYIVTYLIGEVLCECKDKAALEQDPKVKNVINETIIDQNTTAGAAISMRRRISQVLESCNDCTATDLFIAAALAQDVQLNMKEMSDLSNKNPNAIASRRFPQETGGLNIDWYTHFSDRHWFWSNDTNGQVDRFADAIAELKKRSWSLPTGLVDATINSLR